MGNQIQSGKLLEDAHRVGGAENCDGARKTNVFRARSCCAQNDHRSRVHELAAVMFADAKNIETDLVCNHNLFQEIVRALDRAEAYPSSRVRDDCAETVYAN